MSELDTSILGSKLPIHPYLTLVPLLLPNTDPGGQILAVHVSLNLQQVDAENRGRVTNHSPQLLRGFIEVEQRVSTLRA